nr:MAG TPA: hypothetical protein [Caudoviricetes sp.]
MFFLTFYFPPILLVYAFPLIKKDNVQIRIKTIL